MLVFVESRLNEGQIPEIWENEEEKQLTVDGLRRFYKEFSRKNFKQHPYVKAYNDDVRFFYYYKLTDIQINQKP